MPVPYRKSPPVLSTRCAGFLDVVWLPSSRTFYGALFLIDARGQPVEFVHSHLSAPAGFLWPEDQVRSAGVASLCHALFEACKREPELLVCRPTLGSAAYCRAEIAPQVPFAMVSPAVSDGPPEWSWINDPPPPSMPAASLAEEIKRRGFAVEPFSRIRDGLRECYPDAPWSEADGDSDRRA